MCPVSVGRNVLLTPLMLLALAVACGGGETGAPLEPNEPPAEPPGGNPAPGPAPLGTAIYAVDLSNRLMLFGTGSLGTLSRIMPITGLPFGKRIVGIDFRPSNGKLYGVGNDSRVYVLDTLSGAATPVGSGPFTPAIDFFEVHFGVGFDPATERIRLIVAESGANYSINADDGTAVLETSVHYAATDPNASAKPAISGLGFVPLKKGASTRIAASHGAAAMASGPDPLEGVLLVLDADLGVLAESIDPKTGEFVTIGSLEMVIARCTELKVGFNSDGTVNIFAVALTDLGNLAMRINAATGKATPIGVVADNDSPIQGIAYRGSDLPAEVSPWDYRMVPLGAAHAAGATGAKQQPQCAM